MLKSAAVLWIIVAGWCAIPVGMATDLEALRLPEGFHISVYADHVRDARELALGDHGTVFVGSMNAGVVYALTDTDHDGRAEKVTVVARHLQLPSGIAFARGNLYIATVHEILQLPAIESRLDHPPAPMLVADRLPYRDGDHSWHFLGVGPDGHLYVSIGAPCNACEVGTDFGKLIRMNLDGSGREDVAYGIRNSVGFTWQPGTGSLWFTDNGRDLLGDDAPNDELDRVDHPGQHFGFPYCHQGDLPDPVLGAGHPCSRYTPPVLKLGAHVAALGLRFYTGKHWPPAYRGGLLIAEHGSWNRTEKSGYRVMLVSFKDGTPTAYTPLIDGFQRDEHVYGRPADVLELADGSVLVSDDFAGKVYRITYQMP
ncbi:PQQ-dependent sugar dehydrogenase [Frateuria aurantia]